MSNPSAPAKPYILAAIFWIAAVVVFFSPVFFQGKVIAPMDIMDSLLRPWAKAEKIQVHNAFTYDAISQYLPYNYSVHQSLRQDGYIGWNPYTHSGTSIVENTMICPGDWHHHLYRFLPFWSAWNTGIILQFTIAGLGMLMLLRDQKIPAAHALLGVIAFGFYSQFTIWIYHRWVLGAMCWAPWIIWSLSRAKEKKRIVDPYSIIFIALAFRGGHLQSSIFVILLVGLIAMSDCLSSENRFKLNHICKTLILYAISGVFGAMLALDVVIETLPALLHGKREMGSRGWIETLIGLPSLITSIFPGSLGTPQGLDVSKALGVSLFTIKFMGAVPLLLATLALFRRQAPSTAKLLFIVGLILPFTPIDQWLYSRVTVIFALGGSWLAAWYIYNISNEKPSKVWKRCFLILAIIILSWSLASAAIQLNHTFIESKLHAAVAANLPEGKASRSEWMLSRADIFISDALIWNKRNLMMVIFIIVGLFACSKIHLNNKRSHLFALLAAACALGENMLFFNSWVTFSKKPDGQSLYSDFTWVDRLKSAAGNGTILCYDRSDFDYMQLNTPSAYGIRFAEGYETVTPKRINPDTGNDFNPDSCAESGISHVLVSPKNDPGSMSGWEKIINSDEFVLYRNTKFKTICTAYTADGKKHSITPSFTTPNRREIILPDQTVKLTLLESYNPGWKYTIDGKNWNPVTKNNLNAIAINFGKEVEKFNDAKVTLVYKPAYSLSNRIIISFISIFIILYHCISTRIILKKRINQ